MSQHRDRHGLLYFVFVLGCSLVPSWAPLCTLCLSGILWRAGGGHRVVFLLCLPFPGPSISVGMLNTPCSHGWMCCCHRKLMAEVCFPQLPQKVLPLQFLLHGSLGRAHQYSFTLGTVGPFFLLVFVVVYFFNLFFFFPPVYTSCACV